MTDIDRERQKERSHEQQTSAGGGGEESAFKRAQQCSQQHHVQLVSTRCHFERSISQCYILVVARAAHVIPDGVIHIHNLPIGDLSTAINQQHACQCVNETADSAAGGWRVSLTTVLRDAAIAPLLARDRGRFTPRRMVTAPSSPPFRSFATTPRLYSAHRSNLTHYVLEDNCLCMCMCCVGCREYFACCKLSKLSLEC